MTLQLVCILLHGNSEDVIEYFSFPIGIYMLKVNNHSGVFIVKFEQISHNVLMFLRLTLNM